MIPLRYNKNINDAYEEYVKDFKKRLNGWLKNKYVGSKSTKDAKDWKDDRTKMEAVTAQAFNQIFPGLDSMKDDDSFSASLSVIDSEVENVLLYLRDTITIDALVEKNTAKMLELVADIEKKYPDIKVKSSQTYKVVKHAFISLGYENLDKRLFIEATEAKVCPYCNRTFIENVDITKTNNKGIQYAAVIKGELDHFLSKEAHPYLAICRYNLVPSCPFCNHTKSNANNPNIVSPYDLKDHTGVKFRMEITGKKFTDMKDCANAITIKVEDNVLVGQSMEDNIKDFHLRELYNKHTDYAAEIYYKGKLKWNPVYQWWLQKVTAPILGCRLTDEDIERYLIGNYTRPEEFNKRPLSKFQHDLAVDAKIIKE